LIIEKLKADSLIARKNKNSFSSLLTTVVSDCQMVAKNEKRDINDDDCIKVIRKFLKGINEMIEKTNGEQLVFIEEKLLLESYLPRQLSEDEIIEIIQGEQLVGVPEIMKFFKENFSGRYDSKILSSIAKRGL
jgi:uncharacterized protein YqeY